MNELFSILKYCALYYLLLIAAGCSGKPEQETYYDKSKQIKQVNEMLGRAKALSGQQPDSALEYANRSYRESTLLGYREGIRRSLSSISELYLKVHPDIDGYRSFFASVPDSIRSQDTITNAIINLAFAGAYAEKGEPVKALVHGQTALHLSRLISPLDTQLLITASNSVASLHMRLGDTAEANKNWAVSEKFILASKDTGTLLTLYLNRAGILIEQRNFEKAAERIGYVMKISGQRKDSFRMARAGYMGSLLKVRERQPEAALAYLDKTADIAAGLPWYVQEKVTEHWLRAESYLMLGDLKKAEICYLAAIKYAYEQKIPDYRLPGLQQALVELYARMGAYQKAYEFNRSGIQRFLDQLNEHSASEYNNLVIRYDVAEKDKLLARRDLKIAQQKGKLQYRLLWLIILCCSTLLTIIGFSVFFVYKRKKQQLSALRERIDGIEEERGRLSRELHDGIISELSAILIKLKTSTADSTQTFNTHAILQELEKSIVDLRNTSHNLLPDIIGQAGLIDAVRYFCKRISQPGVFEVTTLSYGNLPPVTASFQLNIYRILQELLSNIHKHSDARKVLLQFNVTESQLYITLEDDSSPAPIATVWAGEGIGNMNIGNRLNATNGKWEFRPSGEGMCIYLDFELASHKLQTDNNDKTIHS